MEKSRVEWILKYGLGEVSTLPPELSRIEKLLVELIRNGSGSDITVDDELSPTSENPVQNKVLNSIINGTGSGSVYSKIMLAIAEVVAEAPEDFDTLKEISDWISHHEDSAAAMNTAIQQNTTAIAGKVDKVAGKGLSTNDYTTAEKTKLAGLKNYDDTAVMSDIALNRQTLGTSSKNLLKIVGTTRTVNGITFKVNSDGSIISNGTASSNATFEIGTLSLKSGENVHLSGCPLGGDTGGYCIMWLYTGTWTGVSEYDYGSGATAQISSDATIAIRIRITSGTTVSSLVFHPMLRSADITDDTFEPYKPSLQEQIEELRTQIANMGG